MADIRPAASLTSSLLARRGDARPAMRRQPITHLHMPTAPQEDLGWNDIGEERDRLPPVTSLSAMTPPDFSEPAEPVQLETVELETEEPAYEPAAQAPLSPLTPHLESIAQRINQAPSASTASSFKPMLDRDSGPKRSTKAEALAASRKAAFTLRIDAERHLRLRLLSALVNRSSQQLLIEALDALLAGHGKVEDLAGQVEKSGGALNEAVGF